MSGRETDGKGQRLEGARGGRLAFSLPLPQSVSPRHTHTHTHTHSHTCAHTPAQLSAELSPFSGSWRDPWTLCPRQGRVPVFAGCLHL